ncbi:unnamed protein product [Arctia plantaginis]|uniref:Uncharacterized protein n=1 Tax=Arctia plantaginis TaxID=874455 RepID=A0A8S1AAH0_ARCPL|nr:unnamed protein product [Arctia plantaginis]
MVAYWLTNCAPTSVKTVELIFPVPGHSFMPADRVFGHIEKEVKNKEVIIDPSEYRDIYDHYGVVRKLGAGDDIKRVAEFEDDAQDMDKENEENNAVEEDEANFDEGKN